MTTFEAAFDGDHVRLWVNGHRLRLLWALAAIAWAVVAWDWRRGW